VFAGIFFVIFFLGIVTGAPGFAFIVGLVLGGLFGAGVALPTFDIAEQIKSAVRNGRWRRESV
jgi:hypothetical protein